LDLNEKRTKSSLEANSNRFADFRKGCATTKPAGPDTIYYQDDEYFYISQEMFGQIHSGHSPNRMAHLLLEEGYLRPSNERDELRYRLSLPSGKRPRAYGISKTILEP
jgi:hypothetical protein